MGTQKQLIEVLHLGHLQLGGDHHPPCLLGACKRRASSEVTTSPTSNYCGFGEPHSGQWCVCEDRTPEKHLICPCFTYCGDLDASKDPLGWKQGGGCCVLCSQDATVLECGTIVTSGLTR